MARYTIEGIVLKSSNYKDADKILTIFSREKGKITAVAKGVRKISSRRAGNLDTLNQIKVGLSESLHGYKTISEVTTLDSFNLLKKSPRNLKHLYYVLELVFRLLEEEQESPMIYELLLDTLRNLEFTESKLGEITKFEISLLKYLGYALSLEKCVSCGRVFDDSWESARFSYSHGGLLCPDCFGNGITLSPETLEVLFLLSKQMPLGKKEGGLKDLSEILRNYIKDILDGNIRTHRIFGSF